jgi:plastocyanin
VIRRRIGLIALGAVALGLVAPHSAVATETTYTYNYPVTVAGYQVLQDSTLKVPHPDVEGSITKMQVDIVDGDGTPVPISRLMLHHIVFLNLGNRDRTCGTFTLFDNASSFPAPERFYAAGEERAKLSLPPGYGYRIDHEDWAMTYMVMNHRSAVDHAQIQYRVTVDDDPTLQEVHPYWADANNCKADPIYTVPGTGGPGSVHDNTSDVVMPESGRIVAGSGHVHGGAFKLTLNEPGCGDRQVAESVPTWGPPDHPFYNVRPILHEPGPINMSAWTTPVGIPVNAGERLQLHSLYDGSRPHMRVMGIMIFFVAPDPSVNSDCGALPGDISTFRTDQPGRAGPVPFTIPLTGLNASGQAITIKHPPGKLKRVKGGATIQVSDYFFSRRNVRIKRGQSLKWRFPAGNLHNVTLANGPVGIASPNLNGERSFSTRFTRPGTYRFFCGLHPVQMSERVVVKKRKHRKHKGHGKRG